ncbi:diiron oxygenase [Nocardia fluminea]
MPWRSLHHLAAPNKAVLSIAMPIVMFILGRAIATPPKTFFKQFDMPAEVRKDLFYGSKESKRTFADYYVDVRAPAEEIGLMNPVAPLTWAVRADRRNGGYRCRGESRAYRHPAAIRFSRGSIPGPCGR